MAEPLSLKHRRQMMEIFGKLELPISEFNFSNLYLFRGVHKYGVSQIGPEEYVLEGASYSGSKFLMPLFHPSSWKELIAEAKRRGATYVYPVPESWWSEVKQGGVNLEISEDDTDYVYSVEEIASYRGRHLDGHRNAVRNLLSEHQVYVKKIDEAKAKDGLEILAGWTHHFAAGEKNDVQACREALEHFAQLELDGWIFDVDGKPAGLLIGEPLTHDTYLWHFAKASVRLHGLYPLMYQECAKAIQPKFQLINMEQDLGIETLRVAKRAYHPTMHVKKGRIIVSH